MEQVRTRGSEIFSVAKCPLKRYCKILVLAGAAHINVKLHFSMIDANEHYFEVQSAFYIQKCGRKFDKLNLKKEITEQRRQIFPEMLASARLTHLE